MSKYVKHSLDGRLYVVRPRPGEDAHEWRARHLRFCSVSSIVLQPGALDDRFMLLDDLPPEYRDVLDEQCHKAAAIRPGRKILMLITFRRKFRARGCRRVAHRLPATP